MIGLPDKVRTILLTPHRTVKVGIAIVMGWIMHEYSRYAGFLKGQAGEYTP